MHPSSRLAPECALLFALGIGFGFVPLAGRAAAQTSAAQTTAQTAAQTASNSTAASASVAAPTEGKAGSSGAPASLAVDARLVNLPVVVRDKKGALVQNLTKDDFSLQVDGHPEVIRYFDRDTNLPLTLGLLVDTSASQRKVIDDERTASRAFSTRC